MATAAERERLKTEYLGLAGQAERLRKTSPIATSYDPQALRRFQNIYRSDLDVIVSWRDEMIAKPALGSAAEFSHRIAYAHEVLRHWRDPLPQ